MPSACYILNMLLSKQVYVQKRNEILLEDTAKGYLEERWSWNTTVEGFEA